ncbi:MAG TPA: hypothetical protein VG387_21550 [Rhizomicrobium sp.]|jgi:hypothetical protein|nr:hypothetical protein [Rhizomicrobium sp.]
MREFAAIALLAVVVGLIAVLFAWSGATHERRNTFTSLCWIRSCPPPAVADEDDGRPHPMTDNSFWHYGGLLAYLRIEGATRRFYRDPKQTLNDAELDDDPDDLVFEGTGDHGYWHGMAQLFDRRCDSTYPYRVEGRSRDHDRIVALTGHAPRIDDDCHVAGYNAATNTLTFTFVAEAD